MIDFSAGTLLAHMQDDFTRTKLIETIEHYYDWMAEQVKGLPDPAMTFEPEDPEADDPYAEDKGDVAMAWTLGHVIVHVTASMEEAAARGAALARGVPMRVRSRYETPWESIVSTKQVEQRLSESRRMVLAYLNTWPDDPHLDITYDKYEKHWGKINARGMVLGGIKHIDDHVGQMEDIIGQFKAMEA